MIRKSLLASAVSLSMLLPMLLLLPATTVAARKPSSSNPDLIGAEEFGRKLGRAKKDNLIEAGFMGGMSNAFWGYSVGYTRIVFDGLGAITMPLTYMTTNQIPNSKTTQVMTNSKNTLIGAGMKFRTYAEEIDEGFFYGGGGRIFLITSEYDRQLGGTTTSAHFKFVYQNFIPLAEVGWQQKFTPDFGGIVSLEGGWQFTTYTDLANQVGEDDGFPPMGDPGRTPVYGETMYYYTINAQLFYAF